jgi:hypothetical protein
LFVFVGCGLGFCVPSCGGVNFGFSNMYILNNTHVFLCE